MLFHMKITACLIYCFDDCSITNLATTTALTAIENKIPNVSDLVKKADWCRNKKY